MKLNIKKNVIMTAALASAISFTACTGDLDVVPIDPGLNTPNVVLTDENAYNQLLAKCYSALAVSSPDGSSGNPDIQGIDGGFGQYLRALFNLQELPTDEAVMGWNDQTIKDLHGMKWTSSDVFITAMYGRMSYQIALCNEVIRQLNASSINESKKKQYIAEARALRALSYYHAIDMFGNVPFITDESKVGGDNPQQIKRADLYKWLTETEIPAFINDLPDNPEKYRAGKGLAHAILAKLYLNAQVYAGENAYDKCVQECQNIINLGYQLESSDNWQKMFGASNDMFVGTGHEIIFAVYQDAEHTQAYGGTTYLLSAAIGGNMKPADYGLKGDGWGGLRVTPQFVDKFSGSDIRATFFTDGQNKEIESISTFTEGYAFPKFTNLKADGSTVDASFCSADFPVFRLADIYLMLAECQIKGANVNVNGHDGVWYMNQIRSRAGLSALDNVTEKNILDERSRELAWECHRRSDLVRFGKLTTIDYLWAWKGDAKNGTSVDEHFNLYPIPSSDIVSNTNLKQNDGYK